MAYTPYEWQDLPSTETPIVAEKLNHIEQGIKEAHDDISGVVGAVAEIDETIGIIQSTLSNTQEDVDALETKATNTDIALAEIKLLGWTVPEECPIKNSLNGNTFTQRVGRVELSNASLIKIADASYPNRFQVTLNDMKSDTLNLYMSGYVFKGQGGYGSAIDADKTYAVNSQNVNVHDNSKTDKASFSGAYLYYELATPITKNVDGNEDILHYLSGKAKGIKSLTNGTEERITIPNDGWYFVRAINTTNDGACSAFMLDSSNTYYLSASVTQGGTYIRATTAPIPLRKGTIIIARAFFTNTGELCELY